MTYDVRTIDATGPATGGVLLASDISPELNRDSSGNGRQYGKWWCPPATGSGIIGTGYFDAAGNFKLFNAGEVPASCSFGFEPVPDSCVDGDFGNGYKIAGYTDGTTLDCTGCSGAENSSGGDITWEGEYRDDFSGPGGCEWWIDTGSYQEIDGKVIAGHAIAASKIYLSPGNYWQLTIYLSDGSGGWVEGLTARKYVGSTPEGVYEKESGCITISGDLEVEES
jgi:hypothetical protein